MLCSRLMQMKMKKEKTTSSSSTDQSVGEPAKETKNMLIEECFATDSEDEDSDMQNDDNDEKHPLN